MSSSCRRRRTRRRGRVVAVDINKPAKKYWRTLIPEGGNNDGATWSSSAATSCVHTLKDAHSVLQIYALRGNRVAGDQPSGHRHDRGDLRKAERAGDVLRLRVVPAARADLSLRSRRSGRSRRSQVAEADRRQHGVRDEAGLRARQGRHEGADVHHREEGTDARRPQPDDALRLRRLRHHA